MHLMRTGDEPRRAGRSTGRSRIDPFDVVTFNLLAMLDKLDKFIVIREGDIILKMHPDEAPVLREYAMPLAQNALKTLSAKYSFTPKGPILIEIFPKHDDFAVRNLGLPGMIGALGACFGRVVTLDSPRARPPGSFSWQATLWHEMAHVITLQMSKQRVPRWLTEGISVYEEAQARPEWGREMEVPFALALERGKTLKLADLNSGFTRPDTIALAYFQASLLVDHIVRTHGAAEAAGARPFVRRGARGERRRREDDRRLDGPAAGVVRQDDRRAVRRAAGRASCPARRPGARGSRRREGARGDGGCRGLRAAAAANPENYAAQLALRPGAGGGGRQGGLRAAREGGGAGADGDGRRQPARADGEAGRAARRSDRGDDGVPGAPRPRPHHRRTRPAGWRRSRKRTCAEPVLSIAYDRVVAIDPFDPLGAHRAGTARAEEQPAGDRRARVPGGARDRPGRPRRRRTAISAKPICSPNRPADAKGEALAALEIAPSYERAQELLLRAIQNASAAGAGQ